MYVITSNVPIGNRAGQRRVEVPMEFETAVAAPSRFRVMSDPVTIGLSMANWLFLMVLMSGLMLAATMSGHEQPTGSSSDISTSAVAPR